jgi:exonuclease SbcD
MQQQTAPLTILHTSDWHLGRSLYGRKRYDEFQAFLDWLVQTLEEQQVDVLLVAGDVFDTTAPSNRAQELYYRFLCRVAASPCRHVVVTAGNHDSPSFLNAPRELLKTLNVHVVGQAAEHPAAELLVLRNTENRPELIVAAVPYLRDRDVRRVDAGETVADKGQKLVTGIREHYAAVAAAAEQQRRELGSEIPVVAMGHLFTAGGQTLEGDGVRDLYVGSLAQVGSDIFAASLDYVALGHLHVPQTVQKKQHIRYSGSPLPMGFGEANQQKKVILVAFNSTGTHIDELEVPCFQPLVRIAGSLDAIHARLEQLRQDGSNAWLEIEYTGSDMIGNLQETLLESLAGSAMEIRRIKNRRLMERVINTLQEDETLADLGTADVFARCLEVFAVPEEDRGELTVCYNEIIKDLLEHDRNAE